MTDTLVIAEQPDENAGRRFSWGLAIAGGVAATATTFFLLLLGSGFGLLLVNPVTHAGPTTAGFLTGGAIYFFIAQAFGFAAGGHLAGRLLGPQIESRVQEEFRAAAHGLVAWAVTVLATLTMLALAGLTVASTGAVTAALYGASSKTTETTPSAYLVDVLFRPGPSVAPAAPPPPTASNTDNSDMSPAPSAPANTGEQAPAAANVTSYFNDANARAEAGRILDQGFLRGETLSQGDHDRLVDLIVAQTHVSRLDAANRVDHMQSDVRDKTQRAENATRKAASYASLWIALSLLFGAIVAMAAAVFARAEDDRELAAAG
ncbi:MAG TPA: hypothetical protein VGT78_01375 [Rhizomicrobium sp.]|nr:hypothetical protein [Rhizomicrobium sp.]